MTLKRNIPARIYLLLPCLLPLIGLSILPVLGETVLIESRTTSGASGGITPNPPYQEAAGSWSGSGSHTTAVGTTPGIGSRFAFTNSPVVPVLSLHPTLIAGASYALEVAHIVINASPNIVVNMTYTGCTGTSNSTTAFNSSISPSDWVRVGQITVDNNVTNPVVTFTYASGTLASSGARWYSDAFRFINLAEPCVTALSQLTTVNGPLAAGQTTVDVPGVDAAATAVTVYADGVMIGQKNSGIAAGVNTVTVSPLVKGRIITVTQSNNAAVESCRPNAGPIVGGGANPRVGISLSIRQNTALTGPIGANGGASNTIIKFLAATNLVGGQGTAALGNKVISPSTDWQTVTFLRGPDPANPTDPSFLWNGTDATNPNQLKGNFGVLDSIAFTINDLTDSGPYEVYIDNFVNGGVLIEDFESAAAGANTVMFDQPSFSGTTSPFLLSPSPGSISPDVSKVSNATADTGTNCLKVSWQFKDTAAQDWVRLVEQGSGSPNAQLDLRLPISFRMLLLPVGQSVTSLPPVIVTPPQSQTTFQGSSPILSVFAHGSGPLGYQWRFNGNPIADATKSSLTLTNIQPSAAGNYSVDVSNFVTIVHSTMASVAVVTTTLSSVMTPLWQVATGSRPSLVNDNSQGGLAYNPITQNILYVSRAGGSNAIYVLDGATGVFLRTLNTDPSIITGGALALSLIGVADDGAIYAANLSTNLATPLCKIYYWPDDSGGGTAPELAWAGDPGAGVADTWGGSLAVRGDSDFREIWLGSGSSTMVARILPAFGSDPALNPPNVLSVAGATGGDFSLGLAFGEGDTIWGKSPGGMLRHAHADPNFGTPAVFESFSGYPNMAPLAVDLAYKLLAGISVETPDNLRLFDLTSPGPSLWNLDTEFFPTDNPNPNYAGAVAFGGGRVFALDSNNGIIALDLNLNCVPTKLNATRSGSNLILTWGRPEYRLQGATVLGSWNNISSGSPSTNSVNSGVQFFRLVCP